MMVREENLKNNASKCTPTSTQLLKKYLHTNDDKNHRRKQAAKTKNTTKNWDPCFSTEESRREQNASKSVVARCKKVNVSSNEVCSITLKSTITLEKLYRAVMRPRPASDIIREILKTTGIPGMRLTFTKIFLR